MNDSAAESGNSGLKKMKLSLSYMNKARFMDLCKLQLEIQNRMRIRLIREDIQKSRCQGHDMAI
jgi:hypothetical protein